MTISVSVDDVVVRRQLGRLLGADGRKVLRAGRIKAAELVVDAMPAQSRQQRRTAAGVRARASASGAAVGFASARGRPTVAAWFGAKRRTGWYAAARFDGSAGRQFPRWVGNQFDPDWGATRGRPYGMHQAEVRSWPAVQRALGDAWVDAFNSKGQ